MISPEKTSADLLKELTSAVSFSRFLKENKDLLLQTSLAQQLQKIISAKKIKKSIIFRAAEISEVYGYQILAGTKQPNRSKVLALALALKLTLDETQLLLQQSGYAALYPRNPQDCAVIYGLSHGMPVMEINELLFSNRLETL